MLTDTARLVQAALLAIALFVAGQSGAAELPISGGPRELLITYRSDPANRPAFRSYLQGEGAVLLAKLKRDGVLKSYEFLFNPFVTPGTWDAMAILSFNSYADTQRWKEIERTAPGGLTPAGLRLAKPSGTYSADLAWEGAADEPGPRQNHVFYVIPYEYSAAGEYRKFIDAYLIPQVEGWIKEDVLSRYRIYMNRNPVGPPWDSLFVYEYRDLDSFGRRDEVVAKVRAPLREDPAWKQFNDIKQTIRTEAENTIAELIAGP